MARVWRHRMAHIPCGSVNPRPGHGDLAQCLFPQQDLVMDHAALERASMVGANVRICSHATHATDRTASPGNTLLRVSTELGPHGGEKAVLEVSLTAGGESTEQRRGENVGRHRLLDRRFERPAPFP